MSFTWKHGAIMVGCLALGTAGAAILAKGPGPGDVRIATVTSDDAFGMMEPPPATNVPANTAPIVPAAPTNGAPPTETQVTEEPSGQSVQPIATYVCKNRNGTVRSPIQCDGRKTTHAWLTVTLKRKLLTSATVTLSAFDVNFVSGDAPARATDRYVRIESAIDVRSAAAATVRIAYTPNELTAWNVAAKKLAIAAYDSTTSRWVVLPGVVNQRGAFVQASFATKRLPDQLFALVTKP